MVSVNLYALYTQILGVFQSVAIDWKSPFKEFLEFSTIMRLQDIFHGCKGHVSCQSSKVDQSFAALAQEKTTMNDTKYNVRVWLQLLHFTML